MNLDFKDCTFLIPIRIDSSDRLRNLFLTLKYLLNYTSTNIIVKESDSESKYDKYLKHFFSDDEVKYIFEKNDNILFHKTKILNDMISEAQTQYVSAYDVDIILPLTTLQKTKELLANGADVVYPFVHGILGERKVVFKNEKNYFEQPLELENHGFIANNLNTSFLDENYFYNHNALGYGFSDFGMCQFFNKKSYISGFMENENFLSYAPEDKEKHFRFKILGYDVQRVNDYVYHMEHFRTHNSSHLNPHMSKNNELWAYLQTLNKEQLIVYYKKQDYYVKRTQDVNTIPTNNTKI